MTNVTAIDVVMDDEVPIDTTDYDRMMAEKPDGHRCPECGAELPTKRGLGTHRSLKHGIAGKNRKAHERAGHPDETPGEHQVRSVVENIKAMADEAGAGKVTARPPDAEELTRAFGRGIYTVSAAAASYAVETDRRLHTDELKEQYVTYLSLTPLSAHEIAEPLGRAFHRSPLNKKYGRAVVDNVDVVGSFAELAILFMHWRRYFAERARWEKEMRESGTLPAQLGNELPALPHSEASPPLNGHRPVGQRAGKVLTAEDVQRMMQQS